MSPADLAFMTLRVGFLTRSLEIGGAEKQLVTLARGLTERGIECHILTFYSVGSLREELEDAGIPVIDLRKKGRWDLMAVALRTLRKTRGHKFSILHSYLDGPNIIAGAIRPVLAPTKVVWGFRSAYMDLSAFDYSWRWAFRAQSLLSRKADLIIANSEAGAEQLRESGFSTRHLTVIPNGIDTNRFSPSLSVERRANELRRLWNVPEAATLIGIVARSDPMKDHATFIRAAAEIAAARDDVYFVCVGGEGLMDRAPLFELSEQLGVAPRLTWAGQQDDMPAVYAALDLVSTSSVAEGFPNVIAEAMSMECLPVVTDVGDSARIIGDCGRAVPPQNPSELANAWLGTLRVGPDDAARRKRLCRKRIEDLFSVDAMVGATVDAYSAVAASPRV